MIGKVALKLLPTFFDAAPMPAGLRAEALAGLGRQPKTLSPKLLYDAEGSRLFEAICALPEYYPTRTERGILNARAGEIGDLVGQGCVLVEPGAGNCSKVETLLPALKPSTYVPSDISEEHLYEAALALSSRYPWLPITAARADFTQLDALHACVPGGRRVVFFPGSTIGNFEPFQARHFLRTVTDFVGPDGGLLIGVDLKKPVAVLEAAYNDRQGITAAFNLNLLHRINRELGADFAVERFRHRAVYNPDCGRVEMHLISRCDQTVRVGGRRFHFAGGESIHTENSYKYDIEEFQALGRQAGLVPCRAWVDENRLFSVHWLTAC